MVGQLCEMYTESSCFADSKTITWLVDITIGFQKCTFKLWDLDKNIKTIIRFLTFLFIETSKEFDKRVVNWFHEYESEQNRVFIWALSWKLFFSSAFS